MTQEDLQRDVVTLESMRADAGFSHEYATLDRAIETARILASMSDQQRGAVGRALSRLADSAERETAIVENEPGWAEDADAHRKVARLMGGRDG